MMFWTAFAVSIHATLAGGDVYDFGEDNIVDVSIHATLAGGDGVTSRYTITAPLFLSTPPSRVATRITKEAA